MKYIKTPPEFTTSAQVSSEQPVVHRSPPVRGSQGAAALAVELRQRLARNIRRLAEGRALSIAELSDASGVDQRELMAVLTRNVAPTLDWLCRIAVALGVDPMALLASKSRVPPRRPHPSAALPDVQREEFMLDISVR